MQSDDENLKWCWLRALEWDAFVLFVTQPIAPLLFLLNYNWVTITIVLLMLNWIWQILIAYRYVNVLIADLGSLFVHLKWPVSIGVGIYFLANANYANAVVSAAWPLIVLGLTLLSSFVRPNKPEAATLQTRFMQKLGYQRKEDGLT